jgi:protein-disulfide isomerase
MSKQSARERIQERRGQQRRQTQMILVGVVTVLALGVVGLLVVFNQPRKPLDYPAGNYQGIPESVDRTGAIGLVIGREDAPVSLTEYSDFSCSHCYNLKATIKTLIETYVKPGHLKIIYKPVTFVDEEYSTVAARGVICAAAQGKAWEMHDQTWDLYASRSNRAYTADGISGMARVLQLDMAEFDSCYSSREVTQEIQGVSDEVLAIGVNSTPTLFIDGQRLDFTGPDSLIQAIADKVAAAGGGASATPTQ